MKNQQQPNQAAARKPASAWSRDRLRIGLVQINNSFSGQSYLPYSVGLLQAHLQQHSTHADRLDFLLPVYSRLKVEEIVERLADADLVLFSSYVWNIRLSLEAARRLKALKPGVRVVFGGPQVPDRAEPFLRENPFIDIAVHGEGEQVVRALVDGFDGDAWRQTPGISFLDAGGAFHTTPKGPRLKDINEVPSPYLSGVFQSVMDANPDQQWIALWETNRGCPFSCTFCDWGSSTQSRVYQFQFERLKDEVRWFADHKIEFIFCCDANFGILPRDLDIVQHVAEVKSARGYPEALSVQNTKNATERAYQVQKTLADAGLNKGVTLSMQSVDKDTLKSIKRENISLESYQELQRRFTRDKVETYSDLILGLPGETYRSFTEGVARVVDNGQHNRIQFNNLSILPNAEMGDPDYQKRFGMITVESDIINIHGSLQDADNEILERQQLVVGTAAMPPEDWVKTRAYCWMTALMHFDKVFQIPIITAHELAGLDYGEIFTRFAESEFKDHPTLRLVGEFFRAKARDIQRGGPEYTLSTKFLNIFWPADELILIRLISEDRVEAFYQEALEVLKGMVGRDQKSVWPILDEATRLNRSLLKLPFVSEDLEVEVHYNLWEFYRGVLTGDRVPPREAPTTHQIDRSSVSYDNWDDFCREVIWYGNKKGAYLYTNRVVERQIAGIY